MAEISGLILAGGAGRRMGGVDKGLLPYRGRPLVRHAIDRLTPQVGTLLISANRHLDDYRAFGFPVLTDEHPDRPGPLAGLHAGLAACPTPWLVIAPCDCPALPTDLVARLWNAVTTSGIPPCIAVARVAGRLQPTFQLCHRDLSPALAAHLAAGERRVGGWCRAMNAIEVDFPDPDAFHNINTPDQLTTAALSR